MAVNAGPDVWMLRSAVDRARYCYRERFLIEHYGIRDDSEDIDEAEVVAIVDELMDAVKADIPASVQDTTENPDPITEQSSAASGNPTRPGAEPNQ